jgi:DNA repair protein RadC
MIPKEYKVIALRECVAPNDMAICDTPENAVAYWRENIEKSAGFNPEVECFVVIMLNTRRKVKGHILVSSGTMDTILVHPREVFRAAIISASHSIIIMHNHPSGESDPSDADIKVTRDLIRAGQTLKIEVLDHVVVGHADHGKGHTSLRELGYFYAT